MSDSIVYRKDVSHLIKKYFDENYIIDGAWYADELIRELSDLPSAEPTRCQHCKYAMAVKNQIVEEVKSAKKTGKWIKEKHHHKDQFQEFDYYTIYCSVCGSPPEKNWHLTHFCPNCGNRLLEDGGAE